MWYLHIRIGPVSKENILFDLKYYVFIIQFDTITSLFWIHPFLSLFSSVMIVDEVRIMADGANNHGFSLRERERVGCMTEQQYFF